MHATQYRRKMRVYLVQTTIQSNKILTQLNDYLKIQKFPNLITK
jgi:hypothetical protein